MRSLTKLLIGCGITGIATVIGALVLSVVVFGAGVFVFGWNYSDTPRDRARLQVICEPVKDVPLVIEAHRDRHGEYPRTISGLDSTLPGATATIDALSDLNFVYSSAEGSSFTIYKKLSWDGGIQYESSDPGWKYGIRDESDWPIY